MPGSTALYGLPYALTTDSPHGPNQQQALANEVEFELSRIDGALSASAWTAYTPIWRSGAGGTALSIGDGAAEGWWKRLPGRVINYEFLLTRGGTTHFGTTYYTFSLPVAPANILMVHGSGLVFQSPANRTLGLHGLSGSEVVLTDPVGNAVGATPNGNITAWGTGNRLGGTIVYRAAS